MEECICCQFHPKSLKDLGSRGGLDRFSVTHTSTLNSDDFKRKTAGKLYENVSCCCDQNKHE
ncbi:hypothetical protein Q8A73_006454 [Channa argus]|nr:hypothetical protein Q8A73_006454 [Channa argus]